MAAAAAAVTSALNTEAQPVTTEAQPTITTPPVAAPTAPAPSSGGHPAWNEVLSAIPTALHESVRPVLSKWDTGVQEKLAQVHSQYEPYKEFLGIDPQELGAARQIYSILQSDPQRVYDELAAFLGIGSEQGQQDEDAVDLGEFGEVDISKDPRFQQLAAQQQQMQEFLAQQAAQQEAQQASAWLDTKLNAVTAAYKERGIEPDMEYIISVAAGLLNANPNANEDAVIDQAVAKYDLALQRMGSARTAGATAPTVLSPSGTVPSSGFDASKLSDKERRDLAAQALTQALGG